MTTTELRGIVPRIISKLDDDNFIEALKLAEGNTKIAQKLIPLRAYIQYRLSNYQKVLELYKSMNGSVQRELGSMHLLAQTQYKLAQKSGNFNEVNTYQQILEFHPKQATSAEYIVNALAAYINAGDITKAQGLLNKIDFTTLFTTIKSGTAKSTTNDLLTYEALFNASFVYMEQYELDTALQIAEKAYNRFQLENGQDDDIDMSEDAILQYHIAYVQKLQGNQKPFNITFEHLLSQMETFSTPMQSILQLNNTILKLQNVTSTTITIKNNEKVHDLIKQIEQCKDEYNDKLSKLQLNLIMYNLGIFYAMNKNNDVATKIITALPIDKTTTVNKYQQTTTIPYITTNSYDIQNYNKEWLLTTLQLYIHLKEKDYNKCEEVLNKFQTGITPHLTTNTTLIPYYINLQLSRIYIALYRHQIPNAMSLLQKFVDDDIITTYLKDNKIITNNLPLSQQPAILALFITFNEENKNFEQCSKLIDDVIQLYTKNPILSKDPQSTHIVTQLRTKHATIKASAGDYNGAITTLETLANQCNQKNQTEVVAYYHYISQIVTLCNTHLPELVDKYTAMLPDPSIDDISTNDLSQYQLQVQTNDYMAKKSQKDGTDTSSPQQQFLPNGKHKFSAEKLAQVRLMKKEKRAKKPRLPKNVTMAMYIEARKDGFSKINPWRWKPKWERPQVTTKGRKGQQNQSKLGKGPQGSGVSENQVETNVANAPTQSAAELKKQKIQEAMKNQKGGKKGGKR